MGFIPLLCSELFLRLRTYTQLYIKYKYSRVLVVFCEYTAFIMRVCGLYSIGFQRCLPLAAALPFQSALRSFFRRGCRSCGGVFACRLCHSHSTLLYGMSRYAFLLLPFNHRPFVSKLPLIIFSVNISAVSATSLNELELVKFSLCIKQSYIFGFTLILKLFINFVNS